MRSWCGRGSGATRTPIPMDCYVPPSREQAKFHIFRQLRRPKPFCTSRVPSAHCSRLTVSSEGDRFAMRTCGATIPASVTSFRPLRPPRLKSAASPTPLASTRRRAIRPSVLRSSYRTVEAAAIFFFGARVATAAIRRSTLPFRGGAPNPIYHQHRTTGPRRGRAEEIREGIEVALELKLGADGLALMPLVRQANKPSYCGPSGKRCAQRKRWNRFGPC